WQTVAFTTTTTKWNVDKIVNGDGSGEEFYAPFTMRVKGLEKPEKYLGSWDENNTDLAVSSIVPNDGWYYLLGGSERIALVTKDNTSDYVIFFYDIKTKQITKTEVLFGKDIIGQVEEKNIDKVIAEKKLSILGVDLLSDLNDDGTIDDKDRKLKSEDGTGVSEYLFADDNISNGDWDKGDSLAPSGYKNDDDVEPLVLCYDGLKNLAQKVRGIYIWIEHPGIELVKLYKTSECKDSDLVEFPWDVAKKGLPPEKLFLLASKNVSTQIDGNLIIYIGDARKKKYASDIIALSIVKSIGDTHFFQACRDYIMERNTKYWMGEKRFFTEKESLKVYRMLVMREESTKMQALETYWRDKKLWGIDQVVAEYPKATVVINANFCFDVDPNAAGRWKNLTKYCHGRLISGGMISKASSDNDDQKKLGPLYPGDSPDGLRDNKPFNITNPLRGAWYAGEEAKYIAQADGKFVIAKGRVPLNKKYSEAMGGFHTNYKQNPEQMIGIGLAGKHRMIFTATSINGSGSKTIATFAKESGVPQLPGEPGAIMLIVGDAGTSVALSVNYPDEKTRIVDKVDKHTLTSPYIPSLRRGAYCINTYMLFTSTKPRK
ncbi:MAG TPA: hypothetical protein P5239_08195, partial [Victivallales bacterium]|nr:hypothetical protein [Victivallales bacterium]